MSQVKIGLHFIPTHHRPQDMDFVAACPSPSVKVVYSSKPNADHLREVMRRAPGLVVLRDHALSEQHDDIWRDPAGTGIRHAREWREHLDEIGGLALDRIVVEGINEFTQEQPGSIPAQLAYELAFGNEGQRLGVNTLHGEFSVGWPGNGGIDDAPPDWTPWEPLLAWIDAHPGCYLGLHEYWGFNTGVHFYAGWWFLRYRQMRHKVPTMLTELGGLRARQNQDGTWGLVARDGWKGSEQNGDGISAEQYLAQWQQAEAELRTDPNIHSAHLFTTDGGHPWIEECDAEPVNQRWLEWAKQQPALPVTPAQGGHTTHLPQVGHDAGPQTPTAEPTQPQPEAPQYPPGIIDPWALEAITQVESGMRSFAGGRMVIRFEAHIFERELDDPGLFAAHFRYSDGQPWQEQMWRRWQGEPWTGIHTGSQDSEWAAFEFARQLDETAAMRSISMGAPQIMGFNHARIGYPTVQTMFAEFGETAFHQWAGLVNFILSSPELADALRRRDWREVARLYNGPGQVDAVSAQLANAYALMRGETATA